jgi:hypothetical protein
VGIGRLWFLAAEGGRDCKERTVVVTPDKKDEKP